MFSLARFFNRTATPAPTLEDPPANTRAVANKSGVVRYYWRPNSGDMRRGCPIQSRPLGPDRAAAFRKAKILNQQLQTWRDSVRILPWPESPRPRYRKPDAGMLAAAA